MMNTKLTLNLSKDVIEKAKDYAKRNRISLSKLIESYLQSVTAKSSDEEASPLVKSLTGVIPEQSDADAKKDYYEYLEKKYS